MFYEIIILPKLLKILSFTFMVVLILSGIFYNLSFSMDKVNTYSVNTPDLSNRVLIATQGSSFKNELTDSIVSVLSKDNFYIKVVDVDKLKDVNPTDWAAVIVMHTWEYWQPQKDAAKFLNLYKDENNVIVVATSGGNNRMIHGVEGWSSASTLTDIPFLTEQISWKIRHWSGSVSNEWKKNRE